MPSKGFSPPGPHRPAAALGGLCRASPCRVGVTIQRDCCREARNRREGVGGTYMAMSAASRE